VPTDDDLAFERKRDATLPSVSVVRKRASTLVQRAALLREFIGSHPGWSDLEVILENATRSASLDEIHDEGKTQTFGFVSLVQYGRHFKIGCTNSTERRMREIQLQLPSRTRLIHQIETDDPSGIEAYWHRRFDANDTAPNGLP
jgi:hypothetical protein